MDTDYMLAAALKKCMTKAPLDKITVKDITDVCGVSRQTFYRHFQDKQDLVNWYFEVILEESFRHMGKGKTAGKQIFFHTKRKGVFCGSIQKR